MAKGETVTSPGRGLVGKVIVCSLGGALAGALVGLAFVAFIAGLYSRESYSIHEPFFTYLGLLIGLGAGAIAGAIAGATQLIADALRGDRKTEK
jgi:hypothetical protein